MAESGAGLILAPDELVELTGYKRAADQLGELHRQGFWRARRSPTTGDIILERAHFDAVCGSPKAGPQVKAPEVKLLHAV